MNLDCNRKRVKQNQNSHFDIIEKLKRGVVKIVVKNGKDNKILKPVLCTLNNKLLPSEDSTQYKNIEGQEKNPDILVWAFNKNYNKNVDPTSGWCKIPLSSIAHYEYIDEVK